MAMKELYKTLKDHKNGFMQDLVQSSYQTIYQDEVQRFMNETDEIDLEECGGVCCESTCSKPVLPTFIVVSDFKNGRRQVTN